MLGDHGTLNADVSIKSIINNYHNMFNDKTIIYEYIFNTNINLKQ